MAAGRRRSAAIKSRGVAIANFILVHGAFHGAWCYAKVANLLRAEGHQVYVPTLSGVGELAHLGASGINLSTHIQDVVAVIRSENLADVILCGHSYAGMVITGVAGQVAERIKTLFYLDATVPGDSQSNLDCGDQDRALAMLELAGENGLAVRPYDAERFGLSRDVAAEVNQRLTPHPVGCFIEKLRFTGKEAMIAHHTFVLAERYQSANHDACAKARNQAGWKVVTLDCGHEVMIECPAELAALLLQEIDR